MKRMFIIGIGATILGMLAHPSLAGQSTQEAMRRKLTYAQGVLEGVTLEKFDLVMTNATRLRDLGQTNAFFVLGNPDYLSRSTNFFRSVDSLISAAKGQNLERATEAYTRVTRSCVECHQQFRREQWVKGQERGANK